MILNDSASLVFPHHERVTARLDVQTETIYFSIVVANIYKTDTVTVNNGSNITLYISEQKNLYHVRNY